MGHAGNGPLTHGAMGVGLQSPECRGAQGHCGVPCKEVLLVVLLLNGLPLAHIHRMINCMGSLQSWGQLRGQHICARHGWQAKNVVGPAGGAGARDGPHAAAPDIALTPVAFVSSPLLKVLSSECPLHCYDIMPAPGPAVMQVPENGKVGVVGSGRGMTAYAKVAKPTLRAEDVPEDA